ncbi:MAG: hypothetical protein ACOCUN_01430 [Jiangellaceae bacterium]
MSDPKRRRDLDDVDVDPDEVLAAETGQPRSRDPGAQMEEEQGVPADDRTSMVGEVPEPEQPAAPADEPVAATAYGTTAWEQEHGESLDDRLAEEEPDRPPRARRRRTPPEDEIGIHEEEEPP